MVRKRSTSSGPQPAELTTEKIEKGIPKLKRRIDELRGFDVGSIEEQFDAKVKALETKVNDSLAGIFGYNTIEHNKYSVRLDTLGVIWGGGEKPLPVVQDAYKKGIKEAIINLTSLKETLEEKLEDIEEGKAEDNTQPIKPSGAPGNRKVLIVHGHDEAAKHMVARFIGKLDLKPVILHEQENEGKTIIEKLEKHAAVDFAVVLLTPDDIGYPASNPDEKKPRARQNVVMELGLFIGALGRSRVCAMKKGDIEIPSDISGVIYVPLDDQGGWKVKLAKEIRAAGISVDMNKAL